MGAGFACKFWSIMNQQICDSLHKSLKKVVAYITDCVFSCTLFQDFVRTGFITNVTPTAVQDFGSRMQLRYHRKADGTTFTSPDEMEIGEFV